MTFKITYSKNKTKRIRADNLDDAERICNERVKSWTDIRVVGGKHEV